MSLTGHIGPALAALAALLLTGGCGNSRTPVLAAGAPAATGPLRPLYLPVPGVLVDIPRDWVTTTSKPPLLATVGSGSAIALSGYPATELDAFEHANGLPRRVRSVHVYGAESEVVLDEYAPPASFHPVDHAVFSAVKRSLRVLR